MKPNNLHNKNETVHRINYRLRRNKHLVAITTQVQSNQVCPCPSPCKRFKCDVDLDYIIMATNAIMMSSEMDAIILAPSPRSTSVLHLSFKQHFAHFCNTKTQNN